MRTILTSSPPAVSLSSQCPGTDSSSIVPALRGFPRSPCVRNHPPTCCSRRRLQTVKPYTESLRAAGQCLMKDSATAGRITNARLLDTIRSRTRAHANIWQICVASKHTHTDIHTHTHKEYKHIVMQGPYSAPGLRGRWELQCGWRGGWRDRWMDGGRLDGWGDLKKCAPRGSEPTSASAQSWSGRGPGPVCWHR